MMPPPPPAPGEDPPPEPVLPAVPVDVFTQRFDRQVRPVLQVWFG
jgi:hypothetical protein